MKKKIILTICSCLILMIIFFNVSSFAVEDNINLVNNTINTEDNIDNNNLEEIQIVYNPSIELLADNVKPGEEFEVSVYITAEKGISSAEFTIKYDNRLEYLGENTQDTVNYTVYENKNEQKIQVAVANKEDIYDKTLITKLKFKTPKETTTETTYEIKIDEVNKLFSIENGQIYNFEATDLLVCVANTSLIANLNYVFVAIGIIAFIVIIILVVILIKLLKKRK